MTTITAYESSSESSTDNSLHDESSKKNNFESVYQEPPVEGLTPPLSDSTASITDPNPSILRHSACQFTADKNWLNIQYHEPNKSTIKQPHELENEMQDPEKNYEDDELNRIHGSFIGMALGDSLGAHVEFRPREYLVEHPVTNLVGGGTWGLAKGQFTDDTSMGLCLANSLIARHDFVPYDQLVRYKWWYQHGYMSSTGTCFDIGEATRDSLIEFIHRQQALAQEQNIPIEDLDYLSDKELLEKFKVDCGDVEAAGNGALMRLAPVPLFFWRHPVQAVEFSGISGVITHGDLKARDACRYYGALIVAALRGETKAQLLDEDFYQKHADWFGAEPLQEQIIRIAHGSYKKPGGYDDGIRGKGYIVDALEAALWAFCYSNDFETGACAAVNLGDDTDTTAAIYGQLAGAFYGYNALPANWIAQIYANKYIETLSKWITHEGTAWSTALEISKQITISTISDDSLSIPDNHINPPMLDPLQYQTLLPTDAPESKNPSVSESTNEKENQSVSLPINQRNDEQQAPPVLLRGAEQQLITSTMTFPDTDDDISNSFHSHIEGEPSLSLATSQVEQNEVFPEILQLSEQGPTVTSNLVKTDQPEVFVPTTPPVLGDIPASATARTDESQISLRTSSQIDEVDTDPVILPLTPEEQISESSIINIQRDDTSLPTTHPALEQEILASTASHIDEDQISSRAASQIDQVDTNLVILPYLTREELQTTNIVELERHDSSLPTTPSVLQPEILILVTPHTDEDEISSRTTSQIDEIATNSVIPSHSSQEEVRTTNLVELVQHDSSLPTTPPVLEQEILASTASHIDEDQLSSRAASQIDHVDTNLVILPYLTQEELHATNIVEFEQHDSSLPTTPIVLQPEILTIVTPHTDEDEISSRATSQIDEIATISVIPSHSTHEELLITNLVELDRHDSSLPTTPPVLEEEILTSTTSNANEDEVSSRATSLIDQAEVSPVILPLTAEKSISEPNIIHIEQDETSLPTTPPVIETILLPVTSPSNEDHTSSRTISQIDEIATNSVIPSYSSQEEVLTTNLVELERHYSSLPTTPPVLEEEILVSTTSHIDEDEISSRATSQIEQVDTTPVILPLITQKSISESNMIHSEQDEIFLPTTPQVIIETVLASVTPRSDEDNISSQATYQIDEVDTNPVLLPHPAQEAVLTTNLVELERHDSSLPMTSPVLEEEILASTTSHIDEDEISSRATSQIEQVDTILVILPLTTEEQTPESSVINTQQHDASLPATSPVLEEEIVTSTTSHANEDEISSLTTSHIDQVEMSPVILPLVTEKSISESNVIHIEQDETSLPMAPPVIETILASVTSCTDEDEISSCTTSQIDQINTNPVILPHPTEEEILATNLVESERHDSSLPMTPPVLEEEISSQTTSQIDQVEVSPALRLSAEQENIDKPNIVTIEQQEVSQRTIPLVVVEEMVSSAMSHDDDDQISSQTTSQIEQIVTSPVIVPRPTQEEVLGTNNVELERHDSSLTMTPPVLDEETLASTTTHIDENEISSQTTSPVILIGTLKEVVPHEEENLISSPPTSSIVSESVPHPMTFSHEEEQDSLKAGDKKQSSEPASVLEEKEITLSSVIAAAREPILQTVTNPVEENSTFPRVMTTLEREHDILRKSSVPHETNVFSYGTTSLREQHSSLGNNLHAQDRVISSPTSTSGQPIPISVTFSSRVEDMHKFSPYNRYTEQNTTSSHSSQFRQQYFNESTARTGSREMRGLPANMAAWTIQDVAEWIQSLDESFREYARIFKSDLVDGYRLFMCFNRHVLLTRYGITSDSHQQKILAAVNRAKEIHVNTYGRLRRR